MTKHFSKKIGHCVKQVKMNLWYNFHTFILYISLVVWDRVILSDFVR